MDELAGLIQALATPVGVLAVIVVTMWRASRWMAPLLDKLVSRHVQFLDAVEKNTTAMNDSIVGLTMRTESVHGKLDNIGRKLEVIEGRFARNSEAGTTK